MIEMTVKENNVTNEELRIAEIERRIELIGDYNSEKEDKILKMIESDSKTDI